MTKGDLEVLRAGISDDVELLSILRNAQKINSFPEESLNASIASIERELARKLKTISDEAKMKAERAEDMNVRQIGVVPVSRFMEITPISAQKFLNAGKRNRKISKSRVARYAKDMKAGAWRTTHQGIAFDREGRLHDGYHRCLAVISAGVSVTMLVTFGIDDSTFDSIDVGGNRSPTDCLTITFDGVGARVARMAAAAAGYTINYLNGRVPCGRLQSTGSVNTIVVEFVRENREILESAEFIASLPRRDALLKDSISCFVHFVISTLVADRATADEFCMRVLIGQELSADSVIFELRRQLIASRMKTRRLAEVVAVNRVIHAYNVWRQGDMLRDPAQSLGRVGGDNRIRFFGDRLINPEPEGGAS